METASGQTKPKSARVFTRKLAAPETLAQRFWTFCLVAFPFLDVFLFRYSFRLFPGPLGYGPFICMYALLPFFVLRFRFPIRVALTIGLVGLVGSSGVLNGIVQPGEFVKVFGSLVLPYLYYWYLWQYLGEDVIKGFRIYLKGAVIVSVIGLLVFIDSVIPFGFYSTLNSLIHLSRTPAAFGIRISSTLGEPTYFANSIAPAGLFALWRLFFREPQFDYYLKEHGLWIERLPALIILAALTLTYSAMAFVGLLIAFVLILLIKRQLRTILFASVMLFGLFTAAQSIPEIRQRIEGLQNASRVADTEVHGSSAILYNHAIITWENFRRHPLTGTGLGSHAIATKKYSILGDTTAFAYSDQNAPDASSMFLRIASELGLFGIVLTLYFLRAHYFKTNIQNHWGLLFKLISAAFLVTILLQLFRQGNFILNGFPFYVYGYHFAWKQLKQREQLQS